MDTLLRLDIIVGRALVLSQSNVPYSEEWMGAGGEGNGSRGGSGNWD